MHLTSKVPATALSLGTLFHEALALLYSGANFEATMKLVEQQANTEEYKTLSAMLTGYADILLYEDLEKWQILDVEHKFKFLSGLKTQIGLKCKDTECGTEYPHSIIYHDCEACGAFCDEVFEEIMCVGAIDLIVYEATTNTVKGIEHKTCARFREEAFSWLDEQPRVYFEALNKWISGAISKGLVPSDVTNGGILINEVRKLKRDFDYKRTPHLYTEVDHERFWKMWLKQLQACHNSILLDEKGEPPSPTYFGCQMCDYKHVCSTFGYEVVTKETILNEYGLEFEPRARDHLEEKNKLGGTDAP